MQFVKIMVPSGQCKINYTMWYNLARPHIVKLATSWNLIGGMMQPTHPFLCLQNWAYISIYRFLQWNTYCTTKLQIKKTKKKNTKIFSKFVTIVIGYDVFHNFYHGMPFIIWTLYMVLLLWTSDWILQYDVVIVIFMYEFIRFSYLFSFLYSQYIHGLAARGVHYLHRPGPILQDIGFRILPVCTFCIMEIACWQCLHLSIF